MYALTRKVGETTEILAVSENKDKLSARMAKEVIETVHEMYGDDDEPWDWLTPVSAGMTYWSDMDESCPIVYMIQETEVL